MNRFRYVAIALALMPSAALAETKVTEAKSPLIQRWERFQAKHSARVFNEKPCSPGTYEGFRIVYSPDTGLAPEQNEDCKKVYK